MKLNRILATAITLLPLAANAATLVIPAAGTGPGAYDSKWQSDVTLHNTSSQAIPVKFTYFSQAAPASATITVAPRSTQTIADIVKNKFAAEAGTGAIVAEVADDAASRLVINSRTVNVSVDGTFGQDVPAIDVKNAATAGDLVVISGPATATAERFNFGLFALANTTVRWELLRADGTIAATSDQTYTTNTQKQYNAGVASLFNTTAADNDTVHATVKEGSAIFYGSTINQESGDPTFVPALRARADLRITFTGVDLDENGTADLLDADRDGVVDEPLVAYVSAFPNYFRLLVEGAGNTQATFTILETPAAAQLLDSNGTIMLAGTGDMIGKTGTLKVRVTVGDESAVINIPVLFR